MAAGFMYAGIFAGSTLMLWITFDPTVAVRIVGWFKRRIS